MVPGAGLGWLALQAGLLWGRFKHFILLLGAWFSKQHCVRRKLDAARALGYSALFDHEWFVGNCLLLNSSCQLHARSSCQWSSWPHYGAIDGPQNR